MSRIESEFGPKLEDINLNPLLSALKISTDHLAGLVVPQLRTLLEKFPETKDLVDPSHAGVWISKARDVLRHAPPQQNAPATDESI